MSLPHIPGDRFELRKLLGSGSFGTVYEAFDRQRNRTVALKVLERVSADSISRFKREFRILSELRHPNLVSMYELMVIGDYWILSMELIGGSELLEHLAFVELQQSFLEARTPTQPMFDGEATIVLRTPAARTKAISPFYVEQVRATFRQIAVAIATLHARGVVHRDVKPSNIMITPEGRVVLLDFGLVAQVALEDTLDRRTVVGTPGYMSPEQVIASPPTPASDWYGFGVLLYQALTAQMPFAGQTALEIIEHQLRDEPPRAAGVVGGVPEDLSQLAFECLHRDPLRRPSDDQILERLGIAGFDPERPMRARERTEILIGRGRELRHLRTMFESLERATPRVVMLHGSPGAGKSALIDRFIDELREQGDALVLAGRCHPWESMPFNAIDSIVDSLSREIRRGGMEDVLKRAVAATEVFPALAIEATGTVGEDTILLPPRGEKLTARAVSELNGVIHKVAAERPILIVLDDAQWGDYQSAQVLLRLIERPGEKKVMLLLAYRFEDWRTSLLLQAILNSEITRTEIALRPLSEAMAGRLLESRGVRGKRLAGSFYRQCGGNPALLEMMIGEWTRAEGDPQTLLARTLAARAARLSVAAHRLFELTVAAEGPIDEELVESELELFEIDEPLRTLKNSRLIRLTRTGDLREINVYHPKMREALDSTRHESPAPSPRAASRPA